MKPASFKYVRADSIQGAVSALGVGADDDVKVLAGGQSLVPLMNFRLARPQTLLDINPIPGQSYHRSTDGRMEVGLLCRHRDVELDDTIVGRCDAIREAVPLIGHVAIRNRGTVLGSLVHGDPLAEWSALAVLLRARVRLESVSGARQVDADTWFRGFFQTDIRPDELASSATFEIPESAPGTGTAFQEVARRHGDFCLVSAAAMVRMADPGRIGEVRLVVGGLQPTPWQAPEVVAGCVGQRPDSQVWEELARALPGPDTGISSDIHASASTRRRMAQTLVRRVLAAASARAVAAFERRAADDN